MNIKNISTIREENYTIVFRERAAQSVVGILLAIVLVHTSAAAERLSVPFEEKAPVVHMQTVKGNGEVCMNSGEVPCADVQMDGIMYNLETISISTVPQKLSAKAVVSEGTGQSGYTNVESESAVGGTGTAEGPQEALIQEPVYMVQFDGNGGAITQTHIQLQNYTFAPEEIAQPRRLGKEFTGWYKDAAGTIPFTQAAPGETNLTLYAGWKDYDNYISDEEGYLTLYTGTADDIVDGLLRLPAAVDCVGIRSGTYDYVGCGVYEVYIPANICDIEPGALDVLPDLFYIEVSPDNPFYCSIEGILYSKDGMEQICCPAGR